MLWLFGKDDGELVTYCVQKGQDMTNFQYPNQVKSIATFDGQLEKLLLQPKRT